jgi:excisionase family DNA binding protein
MTTTTTTTTTAFRSDELLTAPDAAAYLGVHLHTLRTWVRAGRLPQVRFGHRTVRFRRTDLDAYAARHVETKQTESKQ